MSLNRLKGIFLRTDNPKTGTAVLSPYGSNQQIESKNGQLKYSESNE